MAALSRRRERELRLALERAGYDVLAIDIGGGGHYKVQIQRNGTQALLIVPQSSYSRRLMANMLKNAKRAVQAMEQRNGCACK